jgi:hypothetical protein
MNNEQEIAVINNGEQKGTSCNGFANTGTIDFESYQKFKRTL